MSRETVLSMLGVCYPLIFSGVMKIVFLRIDQIMIPHFLNAGELGIYSVAVQLSEGLFFIPTILNSALFPLLAEAKERSALELEQSLQRFYNLLAFSSYVIIVGVSLGSRTFIHFLYGPEYESSADVLNLLIWSTLFIHIGVARSAPIVLMNMTRFHFLAMAGGCLLNILMNLLLIPTYGITGAAIASIVSYGFSGFFSTFCYRPLFKTGLMLTRAMVFPRPW